MAIGLQPKLLDSTSPSATLVTTSGGVRHVCQGRAVDTVAGPHGSQHDPETASVTAMAFEQLRSQDAAVQSSAKRMIERMQAINEELDQQWELVGQLTGQRDQEVLVEELDISLVRVHREAEIS